MKKLFNTVGLILSIILTFSCEEKPKLPSISTTIVTEISSMTAVSGGNITTDGGAPIISKGICWNTFDNPTVDNNKTIENGDLLSFSSNITQLTPNTSYYVRAYATNSVGTGYGESVSFKTLGDKPTSNAINASNITINSATVTGSVNPNFLSTTVTFEYGLSPDYGSTITALESPVSGDLGENVTVKADLSGLAPGKTYHFRIKAENSLGITYSSSLTFSTLGQVPTVLTPTTTNLKVNTVTLNGSVNANYLSTTVTFEWGTTTDYGNIIIPAQSPNNGSSPILVTVDLNGLESVTTYNFRIKATNELGTTYSDNLAFKTYAIVDIDGNGYYSATIGTQTWLTENLKTTKYSNGDLIGTTTPATLDISNETEPKYQWAYSGNESNVAIYGRLYTWFVALDNRNVCPTGWHVPSDAEWTILENYLILNGYNYDGTTVDNKIAKSLASTLLWQQSSIEGAVGNNDYPDVQNKSGFSALPSGNRTFTGTFIDLNREAYWWSTTERATLFALQRLIDYRGISTINTGLLKNDNCLSIRCVKD